MCKGEVRQVELILDVERRDTPIVVELRQILYPDNAHAEGTARLLGNMIRLAERIQKIAHYRRGDAVKFVNDNDKPPRSEQNSKPFKEI